MTTSDQDNIILNKLTSSLKNELLIESLGKMLKDIPFLKNNFSTSTIENLAFSLKKMQLSPEEFLYKVNFRRCYEFH